ncbi:MAG: DUF4430 domain-containing protein [Oscillospiraceae bacterium]|nr:DUF4430 domain-containing protein [Oscillospiraceae bacterium]
MPKTKSKINSIIKYAALAVAVVAAASALSVVYGAFIKKPADYGKAVSVSVIIDGKTEISKQIKTESLYLSEVLAEAGLIKDGDISGGIINTINGVTADEKNDEFWRVTKSGEAVDTPVTQTPVEDGDKFEVTLKFYRI